MNKWKPNNFMGHWSDDPRDEIRVRRNAALAQNDTHFTISIELATALVDLRECDATTVLTGDEDGPMPPMTVRCKKLKGHVDESHYNGYISWKQSSQE
jgi:hypothetical protein